MMGALLQDDEMSTQGEAAWVIASAIDDSNSAPPTAPINSADWNDLGEVTVQINGRTFRAIFEDVTDEA